LEPPFDVSPEVIILDLCGTILDSRAVDRRIMDQIGLKYTGKPYSELRKTKDSRLSMRANFRNFFGEYEHEVYKEYIQRLNATVHSTQPFLGVFDFLKTAQAQGVQLCVVTNRPRSYLLEFLDAHPNLPFGDAAFSAIDDFGVEKPDQIVITQSLVRMGVVSLDSSRIAFIGDSIVDIHCADNAGCQPVVFLSAISEYEKDHVLQRSMDASKRPLLFFENYVDLTEALGLMKNT
jgi:phosphoglycolate phosphatase